MAALCMLLSGCFLLLNLLSGVISTNVRLVHGNESYGTVEVYHDGGWGSICDDGFNNKSASVICRMLGYRYGKAYDSAIYGSSTGPIFMDDVYCTGNESDIADCRFAGWTQHNCGHGEDVGVQCYDGSSFQGVRLVHGNDSYGTVEVYHDGEWGSICDDGFNNKSASVICRMLGYRSGTAHGNAPYGTASGPILMDQVNCSGNESDIADCPFDGWTHNDCDHSEDAGVQCYDAENVRLVHGNDSYGTVEVYHAGEWGTICDDRFNNKSASVICRMLGYRSGIAYDGAIYGSSSGPISMDEVNCTGNESDITDCHFNGWYTHDCSHSEDVGVQCYGCGSARRITNGSVRYMNDTTTQYSCDTGYNLIGSSIINCTSTGNWNSPPTCRIKDCASALPIRNGNASYMNGTTTYGSMVQYTCQPGYAMNGSSISYCMSDGTWTMPPSMCLTNDCASALPIRNGNASYMNGTTTYGSMVQYTCQPGYAMNGSSISYCMSDGTWTMPPPMCLTNVADCGPAPGVTNGTVRYMNGTTTYLSMVQYTCQPGYVMNGSDIVSCDSRGMWEIAPMCLANVGRIEDAINVKCNGYAWDVVIDMNKVRQIFPGAMTSNIYMGDNSCTGYETSDGLLHFSQGLRACLTNEVVRNQVLEYTNEIIYAEPDPIHHFIIRGYKWTVTIECDVQRNELSSGHLDHNLHNHNHSGHHVNSNAHYDVLMSFYQDPNFSHELVGNPLNVDIGSKVYVKVYTNVSDWTVKMRVHTCYTKPTANSPNYLQYELIKNGCEVDTNTHILSQATHEAKFVFQDFQYSSDHSGLHVICDAIFCDRTDTSTRCSQTCNPNGP